MHRSMKLTRTAALGLLLGAMACNDDTLTPLLTPIDPLFARYVAMGNSLTAGFQSAGINDSTQLLSYGNLLSHQMQTPFFMPLLNRPGCPPPLIDVFRGTVVGPPLNPALPCALRKQQTVPPPFLNDVAVPGAAVEDILSNISPNSHSNTLTTLILGGLTQSAAMARANPTFVSAWIGNNDVLGAATDPANAGNPALVTDPTVFASRYDSILDAIDATPAKGKGVLIGVVDVTQIPYLTYGKYYFGAFVTGHLPPTMVVLPTCAPGAFGGLGDTTLVPFRYGATLLGEAAAGIPDTLDCLNNHLVEPAELANLHAAVAAYNSHISSQATARGYAYFDPNPALVALRADTSQVVIFPHFPTSPTDTSAGVVERPFGSAFSRDGVHPSAATQRLIANFLIQTINAKYATKLAPIP